MSTLLSSLLLVSFLFTLAICQQTNCTTTTEALIDGSTFRVEDSQITASSSYSNDYRPPEIRLSAEESWCPQDGQGDNSWIQVEFETDVIINELQIGGDGGAFQYYLTQFRVEIGPSSTELSFIPESNSDQPMVFSRSDGPAVTTTVLPAPVVTRVLRIVAVTYQGSVPCVNLEAIGCIKPPDIVTTSIPPLIMTTSTIQPTPTSTVAIEMPGITMTATPTPFTTSQTGALIGAIVGGAVGGVVVLLVTIILLVLLVVCILATSRRKEVRLSEVEYTRAGEVRIVDNEIYGKETPPTSPTEMAPRKPSAGDNTYESIKSLATNPVDLNTYEAIASPNVKASSSIDSRTYEAIGTPPVYTYAAVDTPVRVVVPGDSTARDSDVLVSPEHNGNNHIVEHKNTAYGSMEGVQMTPTHANGEGRDLKIPVGSLVDNAAYAGVKHGFEASDKEEINNPIYGEAQGPAEDTKELINNPMYGMANK